VRHATGACSSGRGRTRRSAEGAAPACGTHRLTQRTGAAAAERGGGRAWRWRGVGDKVEAADPDGGERIGVGHEVLVVVVRGER
jgi:hypothetical protein